MVDIENKIVVLGDGDVKIGFNVLAMLVGRGELPDEGEYSECFDLGILMTAEDTVMLLRELNDIYEGKAESLEFGEYTFKFKTKDDVTFFANNIHTWLEHRVKAFSDAKAAYKEWLWMEVKDDGKN